MNTFALQGYRLQLLHDVRLTSKIIGDDDNQNSRAQAEYEAVVSWTHFTREESSC